MAISLHNIEKHSDDAVVDNYGENTEHAAVAVGIAAVVDEDSTLQHQSRHLLTMPLLHTLQEHHQLHQEHRD
jgi:hypothetical protein